MRHTSLHAQPPISSMMAPTTPPLVFDHEAGFEIPTKNKEVISELHHFTKVLITALQIRYKLGESTIRKILNYHAPERSRLTRTGRPQKLTDRRVDEIIKYCAESWEHRILKYDLLIKELQLPYTPEHLAVRLRQRGYFRCIACQKPFLTATQVIGRFLWAIAHVFWHEEWLKVRWSDEVTFLIGGRTAKEKVTRKRGERDCETCIQQQLHRGHATPVNAWGQLDMDIRVPYSLCTVLEEGSLYSARLFNTNPCSAH